MQNVIVHLSISYYRLYSIIIYHGLLNNKPTISNTPLLFSTVTLYLECPLFRWKTIPVVFWLLRSLDKGASDLKSGGSCSLSGLFLINTQHNFGHVAIDRTGIWPIGRECRNGQISDRPTLPSFFSRTKNFFVWRSELHFVRPGTISFTFCLLVF